MTITVFDLYNPTNSVNITPGELKTCDVDSDKIRFLLGINDDNVELVKELLLYKIIDIKNWKDGSITTQTYNKWRETWRSEYINNKLLWRAMSEIAFSDDVNKYINTNSNIISCVYDPDSETEKQCIDRFVLKFHEVKD